MARLPLRHAGPLRRGGRYGFRAVLGLLALLGLYAILGTDLHAALSGRPRALVPLAGGVTLVLLAAMIPALVRLATLTRPPEGPVTRRKDPP